MSSAGVMGQIAEGWASPGAFVRQKDMQSIFEERGRRRAAFGTGEMVYDSRRGHLAAGV